MGEDPRTVGAPVAADQGPPRDPEQIRDEIEATRRELGDTVEALAAKTDVKARAQEKIKSVRESPPPARVLGVAAAVVVSFIAWRVIRRRRRARQDS